MKENPAVCIICCKCYCSNSDEISRIRKHRHFKEFCEQIEEASKLSKWYKDHGGCGIMGSTFDMMKRHESLSICPDCLEHLISAAVIRSETEPIEAMVITLQVQLLEALKDLESKMGAYYEKISRIGEIVSNSDVTKISSQVEGNESEKIRTRRKSKSTKLSDNNGVLLLRNAIVNVTSELKLYLEDLGQKSSLEKRPITKTLNSTSSQQPIESSDLIVVPKTEVQEDDSLVEISQVHVKVETDVDNMNDLQFSDNEADGNFQDDDYNEVVSGDDESVEPHDSDSDFSPSSPEQMPKRKKGGKSSTQSNSDPTFRSPKRKRLTCDVNLEGLSEFRKRLVRRIMRKERYSKRRDEREETESEKFHLKLVKEYPIEYDMEKGLVVVGGISANVLDDLESLECTLCGYKCKPQGQTAKRETYMDRAIWNHILGKHLKAFKCPQCERLVMSRTHLLKHMKDHEAESLNCDICGKPMASLQTLTGHKWTHMNQEEKEEWERSGRKRPFYKPEGEFQCAICGKEFKRRDSHDKHLLTHVEDREKVVCPLCGKSLYRSSLYTYHQKYACPGNDKKPLRISCELCDVTFKTSIQKKKHMARMHDPKAALRPVSCPQCGKTFKTNDCLRHHLRTHTNETPFVCSKCGSAFKQARYLKRHFKSCQGRVKKEPSRDIRRFMF